MSWLRSPAVGRASRATLGAVYLIVVTAALVLAFSHRAYDDPFITYRYARNLAGGLGLVYNPGEPTLSTTTPLFALVLAALALTGVDLPWAAVLVSGLSLAVGGLLLHDLARTWGAPAAGWAALALYPTFPLLVSTLGSETPLYLALCLGAFALYARRSYLPAALAAAAAALARPDGLLVGGLLGAHFLICRRGREPLPWAAAIAFGLPLAAWAAFAWGTYGSPLPVTLGAKQRQGLLTATTSFLTGFSPLASGYAGRLHYAVAGVLAMIGAARAIFLDRGWLLLLAWPLAYFAAYAWLNVPNYFWYYAPLVPGFVAAAGLGASLPGRLVASVWEGRRSRRRQAEGAGNHAGGSGPLLAGLLAGLLTIAIVLPLMIAQIGDLNRLRRQPDPRAAVYRAAGEWLRENTPPTATVGTLEVGIIGFYAPNPMVDFAGLIQPEVADRFDAESDYEQAALWAVAHYHPDLLVLHHGLFPRLQDAYAARFCRAIERLPGRAYGYALDLVIYDCREGRAGRPPAEVTHRL